VGDSRFCSRGGFQAVEACAGGRPDQINRTSPDSCMMYRTRESTMWWDKEEASPNLDGFFPPVGCRQAISASHMLPRLGGFCCICMSIGDIVACVRCVACMLGDGVLCGGVLDEKLSHKVSKKFPTPTIVISLFCHRYLPVRFHNRTIHLTAYAPCLRRLILLHQQRG